MSEEKKEEKKLEKKDNEQDREEILKVNSLDAEEDYSFKPVGAKVEIKRDEKKNEEDEEKDSFLEWEEESEEEGILPVDVFQTPTSVFIVAPIAGVEADDIDVTLNDDMIIIKGERKMKQKEREIEYLRQECLWGKFSRKIILPCEVQADKIKASYKKGILTIKLPKIEKAKTRKIKISEEE